MQALEVVASLAGALIAVTYLPGLWLRWWYAVRLRSRSTGELALTFDDGPSRELQRRVLDVLDEFNVKATFFLLGARALTSETECRQLAQRGHEVGSHGHAHHNAWTRPVSAIRDIGRGRSALAPWQNVPLFRPPHGKITLWTWLAARVAGLKIAMWTLDSGDTRPSPRTESELCEAIRRRGGGVVLFHIFDRSTPEKNDHVVSMVRTLLQAAEREDWKVIAMSGLVDALADQRVSKPPRDAHRSFEFGTKPR